MTDDAPRTAAFFRLEGVLLRRPTLAAAAYLASNGQGVGERVARLGNVALAAPLALLGELRVGAAQARMTWMGLRGMSEDRLVLLGEEYFEEYLKDDVTDVGKELLKQARRDGRRVVLVSDNVDHVVGPVADLLGADDLICNRLELRHGKATGRLEEPVISGNVAGPWLRRFAGEHGVSVDGSWAYGASGADALLLSAIGQPCAVNPDRQLRRLAKDHDWPVVDG